MSRKKSNGKPDPRSTFPMYQEQYICSQCDSTIPIESVIHEYGKNMKNSLTREARTACPHCGSGWRAHQILEGQHWLTVQLDRIDNQLHLQALRLRIDEKLGVTQLRPAAA